MKLLIKLCVVVGLLTCMAYAGDPHITKQFVRSWPVGHDTTGIAWWHYNLRTMQTNPDNYLTRTSIGSIVQYSSSTNSAAWNVEEGNMPDPWLPGDTCVNIGGWDIEYDNDPANYGTNAAHKGYYFLFSDTLYQPSATQTWKADDTLRIMPKPVASATGGLVDVQLDNPRETDHVPWGAFQYDVIGFILLASNSGGTPNSMVEVGFYPITGGAGGFTICTYNSALVFGVGTWTLYHACKYVTRGTNPGYMFRSPYMSQNSDPLVVVGIAEDDKTPTSCAVFTAPVFRNSTSIRYTVPNQTHVTLKIYSTTGELVQTLVDGVKAAGEHTANFDARELASGIYFYHFETNEETLSGKLTLLR